MSICAFNGSYRFLSNFWPAVVMLDGTDYPSVENAYVAAKTRDLAAREFIRNCTPGAAKKFGRTIKLRDDWDDVKLAIMADLVWLKFQHADLRELLLDTGSQELIEGNTWGDTFWGVCNGVGENHLGKILMNVRQRLMSGDY